MNRLASVLPSDDPLLDLIEVEMRAQGFWRDPSAELLWELEDAASAYAGSTDLVGWCRPALKEE